MLKVQSAIADLFEEHREELSSHPQSTDDQQQNVLDAILTPEDHNADLHQLSQTTEEIPSQQQQWNPYVDQEEPQSWQIKEEQEEFWTNQEGEQLQQLEKVDVAKFPPMFAVKSENDEMHPQSSDFHQGRTEGNIESLSNGLTEKMEIETDEEDFAGSETNKNYEQDSHVQPYTDDTSSEPESEGSSSTQQSPTEVVFAYCKK
ncbi:uncharacterized protein LOC117503442 [Thalassophryne amazonica]|uniref:uncharacterized protein LOC117503442 n=1 Tax=Thalassophryne amazonica TaxID=390379 RepID=UPI0014719F8D|nr:uncharacterized protein LOC117503442 [Thalassophryne amazonica]